MNQNNAALFVIFAVAVGMVVSAMLLLFFVTLFQPWFQCFLARAPLSLPKILEMRLRGMPVRSLCNSYIQAVQAKIDVSMEQIQKAHLRGANVDRCVHAACRAKQRDQRIDWDDLVETDLNH